jgi:hypothetical protein
MLAKGATRKAIVEATGWQVDLKQLAKRKGLTLKKDQHGVINRALTLAGGAHRPSNRLHPEKPEERARKARYGYDPGCVKRRPVGDLGPACARRRVVEASGSVWNRR